MEVPVGAPMTSSAMRYMIDGALPVATISATESYNIGYVCKLEVDIGYVYKRVWIQ
jgi:hypothetical protein